VSRELNKAARLAKRHAENAQARDEAIREALKKHTMREVAAATGLSPGRIHQIAHGR
jgi:hypothetical protein